MQLEDQPWWSSLTPKQKKEVLECGDENQSLYKHERNNGLTHHAAFNAVFGPPVDGTVA